MAFDRPVDRVKDAGLPFGIRALAALLAGVLLTASFAPTDAWFLAPLAIGVLVALLVHGEAVHAPRRVRRGFVLGWLFGLGWLTSALWWLWVSMHDFGGMPGWLAALAVLLLTAWLACWIGAATALWVWGRSGRPGRDAAAFGALWLLAELARAVMFTGFPWAASGYAHTVGPLAGWAPWIGVYGIGALAAGLAALVALWLASRRVPGRRGGAWALGALLLAPLGWWLPANHSQPAGSITVSLLQPNVPQHLKFDPGRLERNLQALEQAVSASRGQVVVTPESVVALPLAMLPPEHVRALQRAVASQGRALLLGVFLGDPDAGFVNSLIGLDAQAEPNAGRFYAYGKRHLLPFGEFIPPGFGWFVRAMNIPLDDQASGKSTAPWHVGGQRLRPLICYEDLFGEDFADALAGPQAATIFVNASNLAWFGRHMVQDQHLQFSRMRALEFQRPIVRSTNTGATAVVDHRGVVTQRLAPEVAGTLEATVEGRLGVTPYAAWLARLGLWPLAVVALAVLGVWWTWGVRAPAPAG